MNAAPLLSHSCTLLEVVVAVCWYAIRGSVMASTRRPSTCGEEGRRRITRVGHGLQTDKRLGVGD